MTLSATPQSATWMAATVCTSVLLPVLIYGWETVNAMTDVTMLPVILTRAIVSSALRVATHRWSETGSVTRLVMYPNALRMPAIAGRYAGPPLSWITLQNLFSTPIAALNGVEMDIATVIATTLSANMI